MMVCVLLLCAVVACCGVLRFGVLCCGLLRGVMWWCDGLCGVVMLVWYGMWCWGTMLSIAVGCDMS